VKTEEHSSENAIAAGIAELRQRFPRTQDLYREVCILLFFRFGITPTANKLYQLVRKGSMSAPTEALNHFWSTLRERSAVTVEHADLPDELKAAAGDMVAAIWRSAQTISQDALAEYRTEAAAEVDEAKAGEAQAQAAHSAVSKVLEDARAQLRTSEELVLQLRQELAAAAAVNAGLEARLEDLNRQMQDIQLRLDRSHEERAAERTKLDERTQLAERRYADMEKRALREIDHERTVVSKLQKSLEAERSVHLSVTERLRSDLSAGQETIGQLRQHVGGLESTVNTLTRERERERDELVQIRAQLEVAARQASGEKARADQLHEEIERYHIERKGSPKRSTQINTGKKSLRKAPSRGDG